MLTNICLLGGDILAEWSDDIPRTDVPAVTFVADSPKGELVLVWLPGCDEPRYMAVLDCDNVERRRIEVKDIYSWMNHNLADWNPRIYVDGICALERAGIYTFYETVSDIDDPIYVSNTKCIINLACFNKEDGNNYRHGNDLYEVIFGGPSDYVARKILP